MNLTMMNGKIVAILESRTGERLAELVARRGAVPLLAPALQEVPDVDPARIGALLRGWRERPFTLAIFQTGVGTEALFHAADSLGLADELDALLESATVAVRGPKPAGPLGARGVRIDLRAAAPFTTETVLEALRGVALDGGRVLVQRFGAANRPLREALEARGAEVEELTTYRWAPPADTGPLTRLLDELAAAGVDAVLFTSAVQVEHLMAHARAAGRESALIAHLNGVVVGSIGPVCSRALRGHGVKPAFEADPPKLGPLLAALEAALGAAPAGAG